MTTSNTIIDIGPTSNLPDVGLGHHKVAKTDILRIVFVLVAVILCWLKIPYWMVIGISAAFLSGYPIFVAAFSNLQARRMTMELSMSIAIFAALGISEIFTALVIMLFVLIAEVLEELTVSRGRNAISYLVSLLPRDVFVRQNDTIKVQALTAVKVGDIVVIKPGARVPVDGIVVAGHSFIDQSTITGEAIPSEKLIGATVYAGTINQSGVIDVKTSGIGNDTAFGKIIHAVENAEHSQAPVEKVADQLAGYLVYFALGSALLTLVLTHNITATISVVIVAGACGIAAGTPLAILGGIGRCAQAGCIVKGGRFLEALNFVDTVAFDKTGTLTYGTPHVIKIDSVNGASEKEIMEYAASAESISEHSLGKAIVEKAQEMALALRRPQLFKYTPGKGIFCTVAGEEILVGNRAFFKESGYDIGCLAELRNDTSEVLVGKSQRLLGVIHIADILRPEAKQAISDLEGMSIKSLLLTGDGRPVAAAIAAELAISEVAAEVLPEKKQDYIKKLRASGKKIAMIGDGINDAPALIEASVGVAIGSGVDVARESADIVLIGNDLRRFVEAVRIARYCRRIIITNFIGTLTVDGIGVLLAALGLVNPLLAAFIHVSSELVFILNSARLLPAVSSSPSCHV